MICRKWPPGSGYLCPALIREPVSSTAQTTPGGPLCQSSRDLLMEMVSLGSPACLEGVKGTEMGVEGQDAVHPAGVCVCV